jgi:hypothetical protein
MLPAALLEDPHLHYDGHLCLAVLALAAASSGVLLAAQTVALCQLPLAVEARHVGCWQQVGRGSRGSHGGKAGNAPAIAAGDDQASGVPAAPEWEPKPPPSTVAAAYAAAADGGAAATSAGGPLAEAALGGYLRGSRVAHRGAVWAACGSGPRTRCTPGDRVAKASHAAWAAEGPGGSTRSGSRALVVLATGQALLVACLLSLVACAPQWVPFAALTIGALAGLVCARELSVFFSCYRSLFHSFTSTCELSLFFISKLIFFSALTHHALFFVCAQGLIVSSAGGANAGDALPAYLLHRLRAPLRGTRFDAHKTAALLQALASREQKTSADAKSSGRKGAGK